MGLSIDEDNNLISNNEVFDATTKGLTTVNDIAKDVEAGKVVVLDTSRLGDEAELLIGNIIASKLFEEYKNSKARGNVRTKTCCKCCD